ncbi:hypothetical protein SDC9_185049 [bioreactor metagenome]|uniref:Uncharacterized protein n=1 Tax=bioreactor metagenome TaxID=1076179 RepID=A0A645HH61_9ZZZZ
MGISHQCQHQHYLNDAANQQVNHGYVLLSGALQYPGEGLHQREEDNADGGGAHQRAGNLEALIVYRIQQVDDRRGKRK